VLIILRLTVFLVVLLAPVCGRSQEPSFEGDIPDQITVGDTIARAGGTASDIALPPWHSVITFIPSTLYSAGREAFAKDNIPTLVGIGGLSAALVLTDNDTWRATKRFREASQTNRTIVDDFVYIGDGLPHFCTAAAFAAFGFATRDWRAVRTGSQIAQALLATSVVVHTLKRIAGRQRPNRATRPGGVWNVFPNQSAYNHSVSRYDAFPSGHLATTVATLTVIMQNYPDATWLKPVRIGLAGIVAFGLVNKGWHWYGDFPVAYAVGTLVGNAAAHPDGGRESNAQSSPAFSISPAIVGSQFGVAVELQL
jgi:hypothetical protein